MLRFEKEFVIDLLDICKISFFNLGGFCPVRQAHQPKPGFPGFRPPPTLLHKSLRFCSATRSARPSNPCHIGHLKLNQKINAGFACKSRQQAQKLAGKKFLLCADNHSAHKSCKRRSRGKPETSGHSVYYFRSNNIIVQNVVNRSSLSHKSHKKRNARS